MIRKKVGTITLAVGLISVGAVLLARNFIDLPIKDIYKYWPVLLIGLGVEIVLYMLMYGKSQNNVKFSVDGLCIILIIVLGVFGSSFNLTHINLDVPFNIDGVNVIDGIRYKTEIKETVVKDKISAGFDIKDVKVNNDFGNVKILPSDTSDIRVEAQVRVRCNDTSKARAYAKDAIEIKEGTVTEFAPKNPPDSEKNDYARAYIDFTIYVPKQVNVDIVNRFGDIEVNEIKGNATIDDKNGNIKIEKIGGEVKIDNAFGDINAADIGGKLTVDDKNGNVTVNRVAGFVSLENHFGNIDAYDLENGITVLNNNGNITVRNTKGKTDVTLSFGNVTTENIDGDVVITNKNGNIDARDVTGGADITNSFGHINLQSSGINDSTVTARTSFGNISTNNKLDVKKSGNEMTVEGRLGSGKNIINLETRNGDIDIQ